MKVSNRMKTLIRKGAPPVAVAVAALWTAGAPASAEAALAGTAGNTVLRNTITVNYADAKGNAQSAISASVDITVNTVSATPTVVSATPVSGSTDGSGATQAYTLRVRTNSNGPRAVSLSAADTASTNMSGYGTAPSGLPGSIFLGATMIDPSDTNGTIASWAAGAAVTFKVPNDGGTPTDGAETGGSVGDGSVNGLKNGDIVYLYSGTTYYGPFSVGTVTEVAVGTGQSAAPDSIQLVNNLGAGALSNLATGYGWQIVEAKDVTVTVTQGTISDPTTPSNWTTTVTATMSGATAGTQNLVTASHMGKISVAKYVRNATAAVVGANPYGSITINGATYSSAGGNAFYNSGVSGKPGDTLEYLAVVTNIGTGNSTAVFATDVMPTYSTLLTWSSYGSGSGSVFAHAKLLGNETDMATAGTGLATVGFGGSTGTAAGSTMTFDLGNGSGWGSGGTLASGQSAYVIYQVKIN